MIRRLLGASGAAVLALTLAAPAHAAPKGFVNTANGMVGVAQEVIVYAPNAVGQTVTLGVQNGATQQTIAASVGSNGYGSAVWTPTLNGTWTVSGLGVAVASGSASITVAPMPTYTVLLAQNNVQQGVTNNLIAGVVAPIGTLTPTGSVYLATTAGNGITTQPLAGQFGSNSATATLPWNPSSGGAIPIQATYQPSSTAFTASTSPVSQPNGTTANSPVAMRWPARLFVGTPTVLQAVLGQGYPDGSVAFSMDGVGISASIPTVNGVATLQWTPPVSGVHTISVNYTGNPQPNQVSQASGVSSQQVNILTALPVDNVTVDPPTQPVWQIASPIRMTVGGSVTLVGTSTSGTTVLFKETGPCTISGSVLFARAAGQCQVTAFSPGNATISPGSETYTVSVQPAPRKTR